MDRETIIENIEKLINSEMETFHYERKDENTVVENYLDNVVIRLLHVNDLYKKGLAGKSDYLSVIREFMLSFNAELCIKDSGLMLNNHFSIYFNESSKKYYATYNVPDFINHKSFVEEAFININSETIKTATPYCLRMNQFMRNLTGFDSFKSFEQKMCVFGALNTPASYTTLLSMPTGGGKSLITQVLGYESKGLSIVIVPTVSLAIDQERVAKKNIKGAKEGEIFCYYSGAKNVDLISSAVRNKTARILFISPEALIKNEQFINLIEEANSINYIKNIIIDEAHIVVAWGDFFRVDYQCLGPWRRELLKVNPSIRTFLLSATYRDDTVKKLKKIFADNNKWLEIRCDSLRKEPKFILNRTNSFYEKKKNVLELVNLMPKPMILYVNSPYDAEYWRKYLYAYDYKNIRTFTGETNSEERQKLIKEWTENRFEIMIATSAFGVGVDKPDVRSVIHLYIPESPDAYYQELGRGGRDSLPCLSIMCINDEDLSKANKHVTKVLTLEKLWGRWWSMYKNPNNIWIGGEISIIASTKPNYNKINYFEEGNETDEKWNINVLLLLNRHNLISISSITQDDNNRYIFTIRILNDLITAESDETMRLFDSIREKEANDSLSAFLLIKSPIENEGKVCWSTMFYDTYPLVSEYCPGCGQHTEVVFDEPYRFPLLIDVSNPQKNIAENVKQLFANTDEICLINYSLTEDIIRKYEPDVIITNQDTCINDDLNPCLIIMNYKEYSDLQKRDNGFYLSGLLMAVYSTNPTEAVNEYRIIKKYQKNGRKTIHISPNDFIVSDLTGKQLSSVINGGVIK